ncbi:MAG: hypothetical protein HY231_18415 [Acidobacteria bacterium]|nr:hypothetical protein [Acidobacteriota bacterium]
MKITVRGSCSECRHANQHTNDAEENLWACPWLGATSAHRLCEVKFTATGDYAFAWFDGSNCTWKGAAEFRVLPQGYAERAVEITRPALDFENWFE